MKDWISYNRGLIPWAIYLVVFSTILLVFSLQREQRNPEHEKVREVCLEIAQRIEGIELVPEQAKFVPIGAIAKGASYSGLMMVWEREKSGIAVECSIVSYGNRIKYFAVNGKDKTNLARREERKK